MLKIFIWYSDFNADCRVLSEGPFPCCWTDYLYSTSSIYCFLTTENERLNFNKWKVNPFYEFIKYTSQTSPLQLQQNPSWRPRKSNNAGTSITPLRRTIEPAASSHVNILRCKHPTMFFPCPSKNNKFP